MDYPEIDSLRELSKRFKLLVLPSDRPPLGNEASMPAVDLFFGSSCYQLYVYDEMADLSDTNPLLNLCLVLMALEDYQEEPDFLAWCRLYGLSTAEPAFRQWHMDLRTLYPELEKRLGNKIEPFISQLDWELNAGAAQELRRRSETDR